MALVVVVQVLARHGPQIALRPDHAEPVRVFAPGHRLDFFAQPELGIVLTALALADDDAALGLGLFRLDAGVVDAIRFDGQRQVNFSRGQRLEVRGAVDPRKGVQRTAAARDLFGDLALAEAFATLEEHVLNPVRNTGRAGQLVPTADPLP